MAMLVSLALGVAGKVAELPIAKAAESPKVQQSVEKDLPMLLDAPLLFVKRH
jgi:hypothetical protein